MFEFNYSQLIQLDVKHCRVNRHGTHVFDFCVRPEGCKGYASGKIHLNKRQEIQINFDNPKINLVDFMEHNSLGIFKEKITEMLLSQITVEQLTKLIK